MKERYTITSIIANLFRGKVMIVNASRREREVTSLGRERATPADRLLEEPRLDGLLLPVFSEAVVQDEEE